MGNKIITQSDRNDIWWEFGEKNRVYVGRDDFAKLNRNASAANLIQISPATFPP